MSLSVDIYLIFIISIITVIYILLFRHVYLLCRYILHPPLLPYNCRLTFVYIHNSCALLFVLGGIYPRT